MNKVELLTIIDETMPTLVKIVLSNAKKKSQEFQKIVGRKVLLKNEEMIQLEFFTKTQTMHKNVSLALASEEIMKYATLYKQMDIFTTTHTYQIRMKDIEDIHVSKKQLETKNNVDVTSQNRKKKYILEEGKPIEALVDLGVFTKDYKIVQAKYDKYRQLNKFIEIVDDVISKEDKEYYHIVDFGCGKSYLTFVLYYYFTEIKHKKVKIVGMDLKESVIQKCNEIAKKYHYDALHFISGDIKDYHSEDPIDVMVTLHACDIATDIALFHAVNKQARIVLSVPCCQHELNNQIENETMNFILKRGILKDRLSAILLMLCVHNY